jgi:hypothetical protein
MTINISLNTLTEINIQAINNWNSVTFGDIKNAIFYFSNNCIYANVNPYKKQYHFNKAKAICWNNNCWNQVW